ncbi:MAG: hypothetical protein KY466_08180 [Gemmatimonadetes bacterium]|nr:hypothetical protein [Gemmatimonadota bacterium]
MSSSEPVGWRTAAITLWAVLGVAGILGRAVYALGGRGLATLRQGLGPLELTLLLVLTAALVYGEGVGALQERWVPAVVRRVGELRRGARRRDVVLAPLYGMGLVGGSRRTTLRSWAGVAAIVVAVLVVRSFPEPWRSIVDLGVAAALAWGTVALLVQAARAFR